VCGPQREVDGPFEKGTERTFAAPIPGGLVFVWAEPKPVDGRFRGEFAAATGRLHAHGVADPIWCYNSYARKTLATVGEQEWPSVSIGPGRFRGWADQWVRLEPGAKPVLKFDIGYPPKPRNVRPRALPLRWSVRVNGRQVWAEEVKPEPGWRPREVSLAAYAGRTVLVTLSARVLGDRDAPPHHTDRPALFGRVRVDGNPDSLAPLDGAALPKPKHVLIEDAFAGPTLDKAWAVHISPAQARKASIAPEDGMLRLTGEHYKHAYIARPLGHDNVSVQARLQAPRTGCSASWNPGLGLYWGEGRYCFITAGGHRGGDEAIAIRGRGARTIPLAPRRVAVRDDNRYDLWVRIVLTEKSIAYASSLDGKTWHVVATVPRTSKHAGPPKSLILGRGTVGPADEFQNDERWPTSIKKAFIGELTVGRD